MKATKQHTASPRGRITLGILGLFCVGAAVVLVFHRGSPPQVGRDKKVLKQVDALYTAVRVKNQKLLDQCAMQLVGLKTAGELPNEAAATLTEIITTARGGNWQEAATNLAWFIRGQSRVSVPKNQFSETKHRS